MAAVLPSLSTPPPIPGPPYIASSRHKARRGVTKSRNKVIYRICTGALRRLVRVVPAVVPPVAEDVQVDAAARGAAELAQRASAGSSSCPTEDESHCRDQEDQTGASHPVKKKKKKKSALFHGPFVKWKSIDLLLSIYAQLAAAHLLLRSL